ncbi:MAG: hypothetical protein M1834_007581, partial [Cirrosporium novae-zelandiae]
MSSQPSVSSNMPSVKFPRHLLKFPQELIDIILSKLPSASLLTLTHVNRYFHDLLFTKTQKFNRRQVANYLRFMETWPDESCTNSKGEIELTCFCCLRCYGPEEFILFPEALGR